MMLASTCFNQAILNRSSVASNDDGTVHDERKNKLEQRATLQQREYFNTNFDH